MRFGCFVFCLLFEAVNCSGSGLPCADVRTFLDDHYRRYWIDPKRFEVTENKQIPPLWRQIVQEYRKKLEALWDQTVQKRDGTPVKAAIYGAAGYDGVSVVFFRNTQVFVHINKEGPFLDPFWLANPEKVVVLEENIVRWDLNAHSVQSASDLYMGLGHMNPRTLSDRVRVQRGILPELLSRLRAFFGSFEIKEIVAFPDFLSQRCHGIVTVDLGGGRPIQQIIYIQGRLKDVDYSGRDYLFLGHHFLPMEVLDDVDGLVVRGVEGMLKPPMALQGSLFFLFLDLISKNGGVVLEGNNGAGLGWEMFWDILEQPGRNVFYRQVVKGMVVDPDLVLSYGRGGRAILLGPVD